LPLIICLWINCYHEVDLTVSTNEME